MPQVSATKEYNTFVGGLITEASPLTFPENASIDESNFVLNRNGSRKRRLGMDYEQDYEFITEPLVLPVIYQSRDKAVYRWDNVSDDATLSFVVVQIGTKLNFLNAFSDSLSSNFVGDISLDTSSGDRPAQFTSISGKLIVAHGARYITVISYDKVSNTFSKERHGIIVRDIWGIDDNLATDFRPVELEIKHKYNLVNQGWGPQSIDDYDGDGEPDNTPFYELFKDNSRTDRYPSNADVVSIGINTADANLFNAELIPRFPVGSTPAPKGSMLIDLFNRSGSRQQAASSVGLVDDNYGNSLLNNYNTSEWGNGVSGAYSLISPLPDVPEWSEIPSDISLTGISTITSYSGRIWISGMESNLSGGDSKSPLLGSYILFSQIINGRDKFSKFYQEADPTSDQISDIVDTDGGSIKIAEMSRCLKLVPMGRSLIVIAENGVWEISGGETNFSATSYQLNKINDIGATSADSVVEAEGRVFYWSKGGIYTLEVDQVSLNIISTNITENTIQTFISNIPSEGMSGAIGTYDPTAKVIRWLYNDSDDYDEAVNRTNYNKELCFDTVLGAFYPNSYERLSSDSPYLGGYVITPRFISSSIINDVVIGSDDIVIGADDVVITESVRSSGSSRIKYLTLVDGASAFTFSNLRNNNFLDWETADSVGIDYSSYLVTGYEILQDTQREKQAVYFTVHFERTETGFEDNGSGDMQPINPSGCLVQSRWDFANSISSGKFGTQFQAYRLNRNYIPSGPADTFDYGKVVVTTKNKLRGRGKALSLRFDSETGKDMILLGWGITYTGNTNV